MKPTREQIETATPEQLNVMVAEMMGWERDKEVPGYWHLHGAPEWPTAQRDLPFFSTDIGAAFQVVEFMSMRGMSFGLWHASHFSSVTHGFTAAFVRSVYPPDREAPTPYRYSMQPQPELAICRAALFWWIEQEDNT